MLLVFRTSHAFKVATIVYMRHEYLVLTATQAVGIGLVRAHVPLVGFCFVHVWVGRWLVALRRKTQL